MAFDLVGWFAAQDGSCKEHNFAKGEMTMLEPRTVPDGRGHTTLGPSMPLPTTPNKSITTV
jgi:hypothetical protein